MCQILKCRGRFWIVRMWSVPCKIGTSRSIREVRYRKDCVTRAVYLAESGGWSGNMMHLSSQSAHIEFRQPCSCRSLLPVNQHTCTFVYFPYSVPRISPHQTLHLPLVIEYASSWWRRFWNILLPYVVSLREVREHAIYRSSEHFFKQSCECARGWKACFSSTPLHIFTRWQHLFTPWLLHRGAFILEPNTYPKWIYSQHMLYIYAKFEGSILTLGGHNAIQRASNNAYAQRLVVSKFVHYIVHNAAPGSGDPYEQCLRWCILVTNTKRHPTLSKSQELGHDVPQRLQVTPLTLRKQHTSPESIQVHSK